MFYRTEIFRRKSESWIRFVCNKSRLKNETGGDILKLANKVDLASLKSNVDKLYIDKLKNIPTNLSNLNS